MFKEGFQVFQLKSDLTSTVAQFKNKIIIKKKYSVVHISKSATDSQRIFFSILRSQHNISTKTQSIFSKICTRKKICPNKSAQTPNI